MPNVKTGAKSPTLPDTFRLKITYRKVGDLKPYAGNARTHSDKQIAQIATSIEQFGFTNPVLIDDADGIVAGHGRVAAAHKLGLTEVPVIKLAHLSDAERRAYVIADNRLAELAGWDNEILAIELQSLSDMDLDFDLEITGFETAEIDLLLDDDIGDHDPADDVHEPVPGPAITQPGDVWHLGRHKLICGDALDAETYQRCCQTNSNQSQFAEECANLPGTKLTPLGESSASVELEIVSRVEVAFLIEMVVHGRMNSGEFLQTSHLPEAQHRPFSSSKRQMGILGTIIQPTASFLPVVVPNNSHRSAIGPQFVGHDDPWLAVAFHRFP